MLCSKFSKHSLQIKTKKEIEMLKMIGASGNEVFMSNGRTWSWSQYVAWEDKRMQIAYDDMMISKNEHSLY